MREIYIAVLNLDGIGGLDFLEGGLSLAGAALRPCWGLLCIGVGEGDVQDAAVFIVHDFVSLVLKDDPGIRFAALLQN